MDPHHAVVIAGGGPTGLMLAGELALAGVDVAIVERRTSQRLTESRAGGLHSRTVEILDQRGIADRFLARGERSRFIGFATTRMDMGDFPTRHNYLLGLWQNHTERLLADRAAELGVSIYRGRLVVGFAQDDAGVDVDLDTGEPLRADYLVGCDGGRSAVRASAGIEFPGWDPTFSCLIAEADVEQVPQWASRPSGDAAEASGRTGRGKRVRLVVIEAELKRGGEPTLDELREALVAAHGTDYGVDNPTWISRFGDTSRQAAAYRDRRVFLAGDAAHVHAPVSGQGVNLGIQDATNLGWKLSQVVKGVCPATLLDTYHAERHPVAARVLHHTMAQGVLLRPDERTRKLRDLTYELLSLYEPRQRIAAMLSGLDIHYGSGEGHPLIGRRMPDLDVTVARQPRRVFALLHAGRPVLLNLGGPARFNDGPWADRVALVEAEHSGTWQLPILGEVAAPQWVLIRPDGYVAWAGDRADAGLADALTFWFGAPRDSRD